MQVGILPAAPLPDSVKVARRPVKPLVLVRVQVWQPISGCNVSSRRPPSEGGGRECNSLHPDHFWKAGRYKLAAPVLKTGSASQRSEHYRRLPPILQPSTKGSPMKPVLRNQSQLLFRKSYKPNRIVRIRPIAKPNFIFRPMRRFGLKPQLELVS